MEKQTTADLLDEYIWGCVEARRQLLCERPEDERDPEELQTCNMAITLLNMRDPRPLDPAEQAGVEKITEAVEWHVGAGGLTDEQVRVLTYTYADICCLADMETDELATVTGKRRQLCCEHAETKRELGEVFPWLLQPPDSSLGIEWGQ